MARRNEKYCKRFCDFVQVSWFCYHTNMNNMAYHALRLGLAITFLWIGVLILRAPDLWAGYLSPWAVKFLIVSPHDAMLATGVLDCVLGLLFLTNFFTRVAGLVAAVHLAIVLIVGGVNDITVRDFGLFGAAIALSVMSRHNHSIKPSPQS